jgi:glycosyltransferase involved in cell wall biosynthesis
VYNGEEYLAECIQSVVDQTYSNWEYVIVDNVSRDRTFEIAQSFARNDSRIRIVRATEFLDIYGNHNRALSEMHAGARYFKFLHADDLLYRECLEKLVGVAERHPSVGLVSSLRSVHGEVEYRVPVAKTDEMCPGSYVVHQELLYREWGTGTPSTVLERAELARERPNFYDRSVWHADTDAALRVLMNHDFGFVHEVLSYTRFHAAAQSSFTMRVNSLRSRDGVLLARYGKGALSRSEYRMRIRRWLGGYGLYLMRERLRPSRRNDREFHDFHCREIDATLRDGRHDRTLMTVLPMYRRLLLDCR